jgi:hypothetical protein
MSLESESIINKLKLQNLQERPVRVIGIDFCTTNSSVAKNLVDPQHIEQLRVLSGHKSAIIKKASPEQ